MKISVIVPVYNTEKYLPRCVESLLSQSVKDIEIILIDDGSSDHSPELCDEYGENNDNIRVLHKENGGLSSARNAGLNIATGDFISFLDSDDAYHKDFLKIMLWEIIEKNCDIAQCDYVRFEGTPPKDVDTYGYNSAVYDLKEIMVSDYSRMEHLFETSVCVKLFKRSVFDNLRFDETIMYLEDVHIKPKIMCNGNRFVDINLPLYYYFKSSEGLVSNRKNTKHYNILVDINVNSFLWDRDMPEIEIITQNKLFSCLYTFGKISKYYEKDLLSEIREMIIGFYDDKIFVLDNSVVKHLYKLLKAEKYMALRTISSLTYDIYKKGRQR